MWKPFLVLIVLVNCGLGTRLAGAVSFEAKDFSALAIEADQIVIGTVATTSARRTGAREIVTDYAFDKLEVVKGTVSTSLLTLTMLGGSVGTDKLTVAGAPTFKRGVRYLVFVTGNGAVMFPLVGGDQGIFQIRGDQLSGVPRVHESIGLGRTGDQHGHQSKSEQQALQNAAQDGDHRMLRSNILARMASTKAVWLIGSPGPSPWILNSLRAARPGSRVTARPV